MKYLIVFGTRPEAIKMVPLVLRLQANKNIECKVCVTAQHREMLDQVLEIFAIKPDYDLNLMRSGQDLYDITANVLLAMRDVLAEYQPDGVFVHGDTTTSMAAAMAAFYQQIPVHHVEAGLRTYERYSPFPEELNRQVTGRFTTMHYAPTELARAHLLSEGVHKDAIIVTGNTVIDALLGTVEKINKGLEQTLHAAVVKHGYVVTERPMLLITGHRRENFGEGFINICKAIQRIAKQFHEFDIVYPVHLNPMVQEPVNQYLSAIDNVYLIAPLDYLQFVYLMMNSYLVLTDSGGIQEEAPSLGKPVLVMRDTTERPEAVEVGTVLLVGTDEEKIYSTVSSLITNSKRYRAMSALSNPYGNGTAAKQIEMALLSNVG